MSQAPFDRVTQAALPSAWTLTLHLLRHGEVETGGRRLALGHQDQPLSAQGEQQARALQQLVLGRALHVDGVISSDLQRCAQPAAALAKALGVPLRLEPALREQDMGRWEGQAWEDLTREQPDQVQAFWDNYVDHAPPGGESLRQQSQRVLAWWSAEEPRLRGGRWVVYSHVGTIRSLLCHSLGHPLEHSLRFAPARGSHSELILAQAGAVLTALGERPGAEPPPAGLRGERPTVAFCGSAGTGKTTLGRALASALDLPFLEEGMRQRIEGGLSLHSLDHDSLRALVEELWSEQRHAEDQARSAHGGFVSDRSAVDFAAFWLHYHFTQDEVATRSFLDTCFAVAKQYDRVVLMPWGVLPLLSDGVRSSNPYLQLHYQTAVEGLLSRAVPEPNTLRLPAIRPLGQRLDWLLQRIPSLSPGEGAQS